MYYKPYCDFDIDSTLVGIERSNDHHGQRQNAQQQVDDDRDY